MRRPVVIPSMELRVLAFAFLLALAPHASAGRVEVPLRVSLETLRAALAAELAERSGEVYREGRCTYLRLEAPVLEPADGRLRLRAPGSGALGAELLGQCQSAAAWHGTAEFLLEPTIDKAGRLRVRIVDSALGDARGGGVEALWDLVKHPVHARLERFSYDVAAVRGELAELLRAVTPPRHAADMLRALEGLQLLEPRVESAHVAVPVAFDVPDAWLAAPPPAPPAAPLDEAELAALEKALQPLDAFLVHSIRQVARDSADPALRQRLFTLLLDTRYAVVALLAGEAPPAADPVRAIFFETWNELRTLLEESRARYAVFIDAGDTLLALERAAPGLGVHLSADGLRRLARSLGSGARGDPLAYEWSDDPELRELFEVEEIRAPLPGTSSRGGFLRASADEPRPLDRWVPSRDQLAEYEARIGELLRSAAAAELARTPLAAPYPGVYAHLVPTTALIESCWRQYVVRGGKPTYLRSQAGSVGIMQINQIVWRGFYDVQRLRWDTAYNVRAGTQILMRYVKDYAIPYAAKSGKPENVPRAAYAVYNAGPRAVGRFDKAKPHPREARVDEKLWTLYRGVASGGTIDLRSCGVRAGGAAERS